MASRIPALALAIGRAGVGGAGLGIAFFGFTVVLGRLFGFVVAEAFPDAINAWAVVGSAASACIALSKAT